MAPIILAWLAFAAPFVVAGPDDLEEFFTAVASTKIAVDALASGAAPFWTSSMALGVPQPFRFHFISHPMAAACGLFDCLTVVRVIVSLHVLAGALVTALIVVQLTASRLLAAVAGLTFLGCSSAIQPTYVDDWLITAINEASLPVLVYAALALLDATPSRAPAWSLALGGLAGLLVSMSFPFLVLLLTGIVLLSEPARLRRQIRWVALAAVVAAVIGGAQLVHLYEQVAMTPPFVPRADHEEPSLALTLWSTFMRPAGAAGDVSWRTVFFGPLFAVSACASAIAARDRRLRPFRLAFTASAVGLIVPERILFDLVTTRWAYRTGVNFFGIVLAAWGVDRLARTGRPWRATAYVILAGHLVTVAAATLAAWRPVAAAAVASAPTGERRLAAGGRVARDIQQVNEEQPGRWLFGEEAYALLRQLRLARHGLAPNQLPMLGVRTLNVVAYGLTLDSLYPVDSMLIGGTPPSAAAVESASFLNVLGVRYVVAAEDDRVPPHLVHIRTAPGNLRIYRNDAAWPEAFFVRRLPTDPVPRLKGCPHTRFFCADFSRYTVDRVEHARVVLERQSDGMTVRFDGAAAERYVLLTEWLQPGWRITSGRARLVPAAEQLIGLVVEPGETQIRLRYFPAVRGLLFLMGVVAEIFVIAALGLFMFGRPAVPRAKSAAGRAIG